MPNRFSAQGYKSKYDCEPYKPVFKLPLKDIPST